MNTPATADPIEATYTRREVAKILKITPQMVSVLIANGDLPAIRLGPRMTRISRADLAALMTRHRTACMERCAAIAPAVAVQPEPAQD